MHDDQDDIKSDVPADGVVPAPGQETELPPRKQRSILAELTKDRLTLLVLCTTAVGYIIADPIKIEWARFGWTLLGTGLAAAAAGMLNQLLEEQRDRKMNRTRQRPLPSGRVGRITVLVMGVVAGYVGVSVLAGMVNLASAGLALANLLIYLLLYTPLKTQTTLNTLVGAVCGAIPPMIGWVAVTGLFQPGAWLLGTILFVWQIPHFMALAWMYRDDYQRGGFRMLPVIDQDGRLTCEVILATSLILIPLGLAGTMLGLAGWFYAAGSAILGLWLTALSVRLYRNRSNRNARVVFLASITYLPLLLILMVVDRGPVNPRAWFQGGRMVIEEQPSDDTSRATGTMTTEDEDV